jgi:hypothetical protein
MITFDSEDLLLEPLLNWLTRTNRTRATTVVVPEFRWFNRRVDLATLTSTGRTSAYELKLRHNPRAIEQAAYNRLAFDRSYVVTAQRPSTATITTAREAEVGIVLITNTTVRTLLQPLVGAPDLALRRRLVSALRSQGGSLADV